MTLQDMNEKVDYRQLFREVRGVIKLDVSMKPYTSLKVGGAADLLVFPKDRDDLRTILRIAKREGLPLFPLGLGSNLLVRDRGIRGVVVSLRDGFQDLTMLKEEGKEVFLFLGGGVGLPRVAATAAKMGLSGFEFGVGIPGSVGGALAMNAGIRDRSISDLVISAEVMNEEGELQTLQKEEIQFAYRTSHFPQGSLIVGGTFRLVREERGKILARQRSYMQYKKLTQPLTFSSAGSIFKNPPDQFAGKLIETVGLKGKRIGGAQVSERHANFIINRRDATAHDVIQLIKCIQQKVFMKTGTILELEIHLIGQ